MMRWLPIPFCRNSLPSLGLAAWCVALSAGVSQAAAQSSAQLAAQESAPSVQAATAPFSGDVLSRVSAAAEHAQPDPVEAVRRFVLDELARTQPQMRVELSVGPMDPRLRLAACAQAEAFLRPGARLWGHGFVGYRCLQRPGWSISIPVVVRLYGDALVARQALPALQPIDAGALRVQEVEWTKEPGPIAVTPPDVLDRSCSRPLEAGQPIALSCLRQAPAVSQGDPVKLVGVGNGFTIATDGTALASAAPGELVRVRTESGRTIAGLARKGRIVEVSF